VNDSAASKAQGVEVKAAFLQETILVPIDDLVPTKAIRPKILRGRKYRQILATLRAVGPVEKPVVTPDPATPGKFDIEDGHLVVHGLKALGVTQVECLVATERDTYSYNKYVVPLTAIQDHKMIVEAVNRGVSPELIAEALDLSLPTVKARHRLLDGICPKAAELLADKSCSGTAFRALRKMNPERQVEAAELMIGQRKFTAAFARALLEGTPPEKLNPEFAKRDSDRTHASAALAQIEQELASLQSQTLTVETTYGDDSLQLVVIKSYLGKLLGQVSLVKWLAEHRPQYLTEFRKIFEERERRTPVGKKRDQVGGQSSRVRNEESG
jgi:ParB-like chromosome segregation protein Spo0J